MVKHHKIKHEALIFFFYLSFSALISPIADMDKAAFTSTRLVSIKRNVSSPIDPLHTLLKVNHLLL